MVKRIAFLDRDGVINKLVARDGQMVSPRTFGDFEVITGVSSALEKLREFDFEIVVVTNQPDISRGLMEMHELEKMNSKLHSLGVHDIRVCPHSDNDNCNCRKPKPGLLVEYLQKYHTSDLDLWMVGDHHRDWLAGEAVGAKVIKIVSEKSAKLSKEWNVCCNLLDAVEKILFYR